MSLHRPWLTVVAAGDGKFVVQHNCNGQVDFTCTDTVDEQTGRLINLAIEEGKRQRSREFFALLNDGKG